MVIFVTFCTSISNLYVALSAFLRLVSCNIVKCEFAKRLNPFLFANERTEMKLKIYLSEAWMCSEFGMLITDVERERVKRA